MSGPNGLPKPWRQAPLGDIVNNIRETAKIDASQAYELWSIPSFSDGAPERVVGSEIGSGKLLVRPNDVLIAKINPRINRVWMVSQPPEGLIQVASPEWLVARLKEPAEVLPHFLKWYATSPSFRRMIEAGVQGVTGSHTRAKTPEVLKLPIPIPPLDEQRAIVAAIEDAFARIDSVLRELMAASRLNDHLVQAVLRDTFLAATGREDEEAAPMVRIGDLGEIRLGRQRAPKYHAGAGMRPYLRVANVFEDRIDTGDVMSMVFSDEEFETYRLHEGDILLNEGQSPELVGRPAMFRGEMESVAFTNSLIRFRPSEAIDGEYALLAFRAMLRNGRFKQEARITTNIAHLSASRFASIEMPLPPLDEQRRRVARAKSALESSTATAAALTTVSERLEMSRASVLHHAMSGIAPMAVAMEIGAEA